MRSIISRQLVAISIEAAASQSLKIQELKTMTNNVIVDLSMDFSVSIVKQCDGIKGKSAIVNQLLRSGTSIGANIHEANYASSRADFIAKMQIALKECYETEYWLELFVKTNILSEEQYKSLKNSCGKIRKLLISSINTAKANA
jgi:four helix bundle protein